MKKSKFFCLIAITILNTISLAGNSPAAVEVTQADFYIAPNGNDNNSGTIDSPFATLEKTRDAVREKIKAGPNKDILVFLRGGTYTLKNTVNFSPEDSGTDKYYVIYAAYPGEEPIISGGQKITGMEEHRDGIWKASTSLNFRQLYVNGIRAVRARTPNGPDEYYRIKEWDTKNKAILIDPNNFKDWSKFKQIEMIVQQTWATQVLRLDSYSTAGNNISLRVQSPEDMIFIRPYPMRLPNQSYHFENSYEFLDNPGEWYLDTDSKTLYYKPRPDEDMKNAEIIAPVLETLISMKGTLDNPVGNIEFEGLTFEHSNWTRPSLYGMLELQTGLHNIKTDANNKNYVARMPAAIYIAGVHHIKFRLNTFRHLGTAALDLNYGTHDDEIAGNIFWDISGNGIQLAKTADENTDIINTVYNPTDQRELCVNDVITNNYFAKVAQDYHGCVAIIGWWPRGIKIEHNDIEDLPYTGIDVGIGWCHVPNAMRNNVIRYNHIHNVMNLLSDGGAIYTESVQSDSEIAYNYIHDILPSRWSAGDIHGIYLDEGSDGFKVHDNVIQNVGGHCLFNHQTGLHNIFYNNVVDITISEGRKFLAQYENFRTGIDEIKNKAGLESDYKDIVTKKVKKLK